MSLDLFRIDDRLLHGQVVVGWGARLHIAYYVVVDDPLAASEWEQELYASGMPEGQRAHFLPVDEAIRKFDELDAAPERGALLTRDTRTMRRLADAGLLKGRRVNIGGLHEQRGHHKAVDYVYLGDEEIEDLEAIAGRVRSVSARDLPTSPEVALGDLLRAARRS